MNIQYAKRMQHLRASEIRELLKATESRQMISFGGGLPDPKLFPIEQIKQASIAVLDESGEEALQYSTTEGFLPLRSWIARRTNERQGTSFSSDNVLIVSGSQQALDLSGKLFIDEGDVVLCESPTYLSAIGAFRTFGARFKEVETDDSGMLPEALERALKETKGVKLIYVIPTFQNPSGRCWSLERRQALVSLAKKYGVLIVEDSPYEELRFGGEEVPAVIGLAPEGTVQFGTFSKILCPGYRIGWVIGPRGIVDKYSLVKQSTDLQSSTIAQRQIAKFLESYDIDAHIGRIKRAYGEKRDLAIQTIESCFPEGVRFTRPKGGLFLWVQLPSKINARELLVRCMERDVSFVPGGAFFPNGGHENTLRINFSCMPKEKLVQGLQIIAEEIGAMV